MNTRMQVLILLSTILFAGNSLQRAASPFPVAKGSPTLQLQPDYTCPEDIPINRSVMTDFLTKPWWEPNRIETNTGHLTTSQIQPLTDSSDLAACQSFNTQYEEAFTDEHRTGGKTYNVSYYKAGQFYFVIIGIRQPENPDVVAVGTSYLIVYNSNLTVVKGYAF